MLNCYKSLISIAFLSFVCLMGNAQVARNLESSSVIQTDENKESLLKDLYKLSVEPGLMERGQPTIFRGKNLEAIQFPVGGIGTGCIQFDGKATPRYWQIFNNMTHDHIPNSFFAIRVKNEKGVSLRALQTEDIAGFKGMKELEASSTFPFISYQFMDDLPVDVKMDVFNPFIPTDLKNSGIPAVFYQITVRNGSDENLELNLFATQQNAIGFSQIPKITEGDSFAERYQKNIDRNSATGNLSKYYGGNKNRIQNKKNAHLLLMEGPFDETEEHFGQMVLISIGDENGKGTASWEESSDFISEFAKRGEISAKSKTGNSKPGSTWTGALNSKFTLEPGESKVLKYVLAWYFPNGLNGGHMDNWDAWGKGDWEGQGNYYANLWGNIHELSDYIIQNHDFLKETTENFSKSFYQTNLPFWLVERIGNQLSILKSRTIFHDKRGYVGLWEGCGSGDGSCAGNCNHVWHYAQAHARLFPEMGRTIKKQSFNAIKGDGQIPYRQPAGSPAFDGQCGDIIGAYREYLLSIDKSWLNEMYPNIKRAMNYLVEKHDADKDGWLSDEPKHTTYDASMTGNPSFLSSLYLTALKASAEMAKVSGDKAQADEWSTIAEKSSKLQNEKLWNGEYFFQIPGEKRATDYENGCQSDQLLGQWWADQLGLKGLYPDYKVYSATNSVFKYNFKSNLRNHVQLARKFAKPHEAAVVGTTWPGDDRTPYASGYSDEIWSTYEYTIGASLIKYNEWKKALVLLRSGFSRYNGLLKTGYKTDNGWGNFGFSGNPFGDDECGQFYSRALSIWSVLLATQGFEYSGPEKKIGFNPKWKPENHVSFFSTAEGWGLFKQERTVTQQLNTIELYFGRLKINEIRIPRYMRNGDVQVVCRLQNKKIEIESSQENDILILKFPSTEVLKGERLEIKQY